MRTSLILALLALAGGASANRNRGVVQGVFTVAPAVVAVQQPVAVQPVVVPVSVSEG